MSKKKRVRITCFRNPGVTRVQTLPVLEIEGGFCLICGGALGRKDRCMTIVDVRANQPVAKNSQHWKTLNVRNAALEKAHRETHGRAGVS